jgi:hypothetical protein
MLMKIKRSLSQVRIGGILCPRPILRLGVFAPGIGWYEVPFLLDTGTMISIISSTLTSTLGLRRSSQMGTTNVHVAGSTRRGHATKMRVRFSEYPDKHFTWPCILAEEPPGPAPVSRTAPATPEEWAERSEGHTMPCLLGTAGFLSDDFDLLIEKEMITLFNRHSWWRKNRKVMWRAFGLAAALVAIAGAILYSRLK